MSLPEEIDSTADTSSSSAPAKQGSKPSYLMKLERLKQAKQLLSSKLKSQLKASKSHGNTKQSTESTTTMKPSSHMASTKPQSNTLGTADAIAKPAISTNITSTKTFVPIKVETPTKSNAADTSQVVNTALPIAAARDSTMKLNIANSSKKRKTFNILENKVLSREEQIDLNKLNWDKSKIKTIQACNVVVTLPVETAANAAELKAKDKQILQVRQKIKDSDGVSLFDLAKKIQAKTVENIRHDQVQQNGTDDVSHTADADVKKTIPVQSIMTNKQKNDNNQSLQKRLSKNKQTATAVLPSESVVMPKFKRIIHINSKGINSCPSVVSSVRSKPTAIDAGKSKSTENNLHASSAKALTANSSAECERKQLEVGEQRSANITPIPAAAVPTDAKPAVPATKSEIIEAYKKSIIEKAMAEIAAKRLLKAQKLQQTLDENKTKQCSASSNNNLSRIIEQAGTAAKPAPSTSNAAIPNEITASAKVSNEILQVPVNAASQRDQPCYSGSLSLTNKTNDLNLKRQIHVATTTKTENKVPKKTAEQTNAKAQLKNHAVSEESSAHENLKAVIVKTTPRERILSQLAERKIQISLCEQKLSKLTKQLQCQTTAPAMAKSLNLFATPKAAPNQATATKCSLNEAISSNADFGNSNSCDSAENTTLFGFQKQSGESKQHTIGYLTEFIGSLQHMNSDKCMPDPVMPATLTTASSILGASSSMPLKKRWELTQNQQNEGSIDVDDKTNEDTVNINADSCQLTVLKTAIQTDATDNLPAHSAQPADALNKLQTELSHKKNDDSLQTTETIIGTCLPGPKKRGRKPKSYYANMSNETVVNNASTIEAKPVTKARRGRPFKHILVQNSNSEEANHSELPVNEAENQNMVHDFNSRLLLIRERQQLDTDEVLTEQADVSSGPLQCGLCLGRTSKANWIKHLGTHYGIGWLVENPPPVITIRSQVLTMMLNYFKINAKKTIDCRMCSKSFRSALGLLQHIESCGVTRKRSICDICGHAYSQLSMRSHKRNCYARAANSSEQPGDLSVELPNNKQHDQKFNNSGRVKRAALIRAETFIKANAEVILNDETDKKASFNLKTLIKHVPTFQLEREKCTEQLTQDGKINCPGAGCSFCTTSLSELESHVNACNLILKPGYHCQLCMQHICYATEEEALAHIKTEHKSITEKRKTDDDASDCNLLEESSEDDTDGSAVVTDESITKTKNIKVKKRKCKSADNGRVFHKKNKQNAPLKLKGKLKNQGRDSARSMFKFFGHRSVNVDEAVRRKWHEFTSQNFSNEQLFPNILPIYNWSTCSMDEYFPKDRLSIKFAKAVTNKFFNKIGDSKQWITEWMELQCFGGINSNDEDLSFVGGPIRLCVWLPLPDYVDDQYLIVLCGREFDVFCKLKAVEPEKTFMLVYKFSFCQPADANSKLLNRQLYYVICIDDGPVQCVSALPSGGYDESLNRLGLIAVGTCQNYVNIYALPLVLTQHVDEGNNCDLKMITLNCSYVLILKVLDNDLATFRTQCVKLCWSEFKKHEYIVAGFANGFIGIYKLQLGTLNHIVRDGKNHFMPINYFFSLNRQVCDLAIHYDVKGMRWLTTVTDRMMYFYDIGNIVRAKLLAANTYQFIIRCIDWSPICSSVCAGKCDGIPNNGRSIVCINPESKMFTHRRVTPVLDAITQLHFSPEQNLLACSSDNGDILLLNTKELQYDDAITKTSLRILSMTDLIRLDEPTVEEEIGEEMNIYRNYGVVFAPLLELQATQLPVFLNDARRHRLPLSKLTRINSLRWNLNGCTKAKCLMAVGYENGLLRVLQVDRTQYSSKFAGRCKKK